MAGVKAVSVDPLMNRSTGTTTIKSSAKIRNPKVTESDTFDALAVEQHRVKVYGGLRPYILEHADRVSFLNELDDYAALPTPWKDIKGIPHFHIFNKIIAKYAPRHYRAVASLAKEYVSL